MYCIVFWTSKGKRILFGKEYYLFGTNQAHKNLLFLNQSKTKAIVCFWTNHEQKNDFWTNQ
jgi:hypothetical protein